MGGQSRVGGGRKGAITTSSQLIRSSSSSSSSIAWGLRGVDALRKSDPPPLVPHCGMDLLHILLLFFKHKVLAFLVVVVISWSVDMVRYEWWWYGMVVWNGPK